MRIQCAWCGRDLGEKDGGEGVTHGICPACLARVLGKTQFLCDPTTPLSQRPAHGWLSQYRDGLD